MSSLPHRVLIVEDDQELRRALERCLVREGCEVSHAADGQAALERVQLSPGPHLVICDLELADTLGRDLLAAGAARRIPMVLLTSQADTQVAADLLRQGATQVLQKPFTPALVRELLDETLGTRRGARRGSGGSHPVIGEDILFRQVISTIDTVADTEATVLLTGESGTGKEVAARAIHLASRRANGPFVAVNCGAIPEALLESELFGHAKGAFTGATHARAGRFLVAEGGTLFLDEVGDMPVSFQVKLLRVLQERTLEVLGETGSRTVDVRIVAATHRDLGRRVQEGTFREDLYYRLAVIELHLPPLRERRSDLPLLVEHFRAAANLRHGRQVDGWSREALVALERWSWPGNIRELANVVERLVILKRAGTIELGDLPPHLQRPAEGPAPDRTAGSERGRADLRPLAPDPASALVLPEGGVDLRRTVAAIEERLIRQALERTGGNRNAAAQLLGLNRTTLVEKLRRMEQPKGGSSDDG